MLPPAVDSKYPEERDTTTDTIPKPRLTRREEGKYIGLRNNQRGEMGENRVYAAIHQYIHTNTADQFLVLKNLDLDNNNGKNIKANLLIHQLQTDLSQVDMRGEHDFVVVVKDVGVILLEVKNSAAGTNISSAEKQLSNGCELMRALMGSVKGTGTLQVPIEKVIVLPNEQTPSPTMSTAYKSHRIHRDSLLDLSPVFDRIVNKLKVSQPNPSLLTTLDFDNFTRVLVGLWCVTPAPPGFIYNKDLASTVRCVTNVDRKVNNQEISSFHESNLGRPVTDVLHCPTDTEEFGALYLTPEQKDLMDNVRHAEVYGAAGTGKTLITLLKCVEIHRNNATEKTLIIAPDPHNYRCWKTLQANSISAEIINSFPPEDINSSSVFIVDLKKFFDGDIMSYYLDLYNVFIDDLPTLTNSWGGCQRFTVRGFRPFFVRFFGFWCKIYRFFKKVT